MILGIKMKRRTKLSDISTNRKVSYAFFNAAANIFSIVFVFLIWVQLAAAGSNTERVVIVFWNHFGEYRLEVLLFALIGLLVIANTVFSIKRMREVKNGN